MWTGQALSYSQMQAARAIAGIGGAVIVLVGITLLMDAFPRHVRSRVLAIYFLAVPLGAAAGWVSGSFFARATVWEIAFLITGSLGVFSAARLPPLKAAGPGGSEEGDRASSAPREVGAARKITST